MHIYIKHTLEVLVICSIQGRNLGFLFSSCHYHENWRKVPCRKGKLVACGSLSQKDWRKAKCNSNLPCLYQNKDKSRATHSLIQKQGKNKAD